jgi:hypothetical protein
MDGGAPEVRPEPFDRRQSRISDRLNRLVGPGAAAFFRDACSLIGKSRLESTSHLVGHCVREIEDAIRNVLRVVLPRAEESGSAEPCIACGRLVQERDVHLKTVRLILAALGIATDSSVGVAWLRNARKLHGWAHRSALSAPNPVDDGFEAFWDDMQNVFDGILGEFEKRFLEVHKSIDLLAEKAEPQRSDVTFLKNSIPNNLASRGYFFEKLGSWKWLAPLERQGFFSDPPPTRRHPDGSVSFPSWPPGRYLARMARHPEAQSDVLRVALNIPATDNNEVHELLAEVALNLPPVLGRDLVAKATEWLSYPQFGPSTQKLAELAKVLAIGGQADAALKLAAAIFAIVPGDSERNQRHRTVHGRIDDHRYGRLLEVCRDVLATVDPSGAYDVFSSLLEQALDEANYTSGDDDYSWIWYPAIERGPDAHRASVVELLVVAVRECACKLANAGSLADSILRIEGKRRPIFRRVALHVLAEAPTQHVSLVEERLVDPTRFRDRHQRHEYLRLAARSFPHVSEATRASFLSRIDSASEPREDAERWSRNHGTEVSTEEVASECRTWQRDMLAPLKDVLPDAWRARYESLVATEGEPRPDASRSRTWVGPTSPLTETDISGMTVSQVVEHLRNWVPSKERMSPSREGLGRQLCAAVAADPPRYASEAAAFVGLDPTYLSGLYRGLHDGLKAGKAFDWQPVLDLANWVADQPRHPEDEDRPDRDADPHWGWARTAIARLLSVGFDAKHGRIPVSSREAVWPIISNLVTDPDPRPKDEARFGGTNMDPPTLSLNTTRGVAMHALIDYGLWVRGTAPAEGKPPAPIPEVLEVLDQHLDLRVDPAICIRSVYGWRLPNLLYLDETWVKARLPAIFPPEVEQGPHRAAAWETYLAFNGVGHDTWSLLEHEYCRAVEDLRAGHTRLVKMTLGAAPIVEHLMTVYWHGKETLETGSVVSRFFEVAPEDLRHDAIESLGRDLESADAEVPEVVIERLKALWEDRLRVGTLAPNLHAKELSAFSWWMKAPRLDLDWRLTQLLSVLRVTGTVDVSFMVVEALADAASVNPKMALTCLEAMLNGASDSWAPSMWSDEARTILERALLSGDTEVNKAARGLIGMFAAKGHLGYKDLLAKDAA